LVEFLERCPGDADRACKGHVDVAVLLDDVLT
jgi:hypothetical protein